MAEKKAFILRINPETLKELQKWADDEFRSLNGQIEYLLQKALNDSGKNKKTKKKKTTKIIFRNQIVTFLFVSRPSINPTHLMQRLLIFFLTSLLLSKSAHAQLLISGKVLDPLTRESLAYVNIGIKGKNIGTTSLSDGSFSITIPARFQNDTLTFSLIAYADFKLPIQSSVKKVIPLFRNPETLQEVSISTGKFVEKKFGLKNRARIHFIDASINQNDIFEIAQLIKLPSTDTKLASVNLFINESNEDSVKFRINLYSYNGSRPTERLNLKPIFKTALLKEGWLHCDISEFNLHAKNEIVIAIEFLPMQTRKKAIAYEVKLGGSTKSFFRKNSLGEWIVPPHHYLMHLTALVPDKTKSSDEDEKESIATQTLISGYVKDTFFIFVHLPENYKKTKNKKYPLILLLDANAYFDIVANFWNPKNKKDLPEAILIGIGYSNVALMDSLRQRDYTFPKALAEDSCSICGGGEQFRNFIYKELLPHADRNFRIDSNEITLMGHSLGGYFPAWNLLQDLATDNKEIKNYICISPSLTYANNYISESTKKLNPSEIKISKQKISISVLVIRKKKSQLPLKRYGINLKKN